MKASISFNGIIFDARSITSEGIEYLDAAEQIKSEITLQMNKTMKDIPFLKIIFIVDTAFIGCGYIKGIIV